MQNLAWLLTCVFIVSVLLACGYAETVVSAEEDGWVSLIPEDGDAIGGWNTDGQGHEPKQYWKVEDGILIGSNPDKKESRLWTDVEYSDYELIVEYQTLSNEFESGVYLRGKSHQVQIGVSLSQKVDLTACLYCPGDKRGKYPQRPEDKVKEAHKVGQWNTLRMVVKGKHIKTYLNGVLINDYEAVVLPEIGPIGLQLHSDVAVKIQFKTIKVRSLVGGVE